MLCASSQASVFTDDMLLCPCLCRTGKAGILATEITISVRSLRYLFSNIYAPGLNLLSGPADVPYQLEVSQCGWACWVAQHCCHNQTQLVIAELTTWQLLIHTTRMRAVIVSSCLQLLKGQIKDFAALHTGAYLGYTTQRRMPVDYGLRSLW
jgi:hypothetical protein